MKILIVEDNKAHLDFLERLIKTNLSKEHYQVLDTNKIFDIASTIHMIDKYLPNLVLLDIELWGNNLGGLEIAKHIHDNYPKMSFMFISKITDEIRFEYALSFEPLWFINKSSLNSKAISDEKNFINQIKVIKSKKEQTFLIDYQAKKSKRNKTISIEEIDYFYQQPFESRRSNIFIKNYKLGKVKHNTLTLAKMLPPFFFRINKNYIINIYSTFLEIDEENGIVYIPNRNNSETEKIIKVSRNYKEEFKRIMNHE